MRDDPEIFLFIFLSQASKKKQQKNASQIKTNDLRERNDPHLILQVSICLQLKKESSIERIFLGLLLKMMTMEK